MTINDIGGRVASVWEGLRPITQKMLAGALQSTASGVVNNKTPKFSYDAHADWEVSRLLTALDEQSRTAEVKKDTAKLSEIKHLAETCVSVLETQSASAEVFIQLAERAIKDNDYNRLDKLGDHLASRYSPGEIAEIIRQTEFPQIRAIAYETLAMMPVQSLIPLLDDPLYSGIAAVTLEQQAYEFESEEARDMLDQFEEENGVSGQ